MRSLLKILGFSVIAVGLWVAPGFADENRVKILVLLDTSSPLKVLHATADDNTGIFWRNIFTEIGRSAAASARNQKHSLTFQATMGAFGERRQLSMNELNKAFNRFGNNFELSFPTEENLGLYLQDGKVNYQKVVADKWRFVLVINEEFCGLATISGSADTLSAATIRKYELHDAVRKNKIAHGTINRAHTKVYPVDEAVSKREIFVNDYPLAVTASCQALVGDLNKKDTLHQIAVEVGLGDRVPALGSILDTYAKHFDYSMKVADEWQKPKFPGLINMKKKNPYQYTQSPKDDAEHIAILVNIDLLIEALGQKYSSLDEYTEMYFHRLAEQGFPLDTLKKFDGLSLNDPWAGYVFDNPRTNGQNIVLFRKIGQEYILNYEIPVIGGMQWLEKHKKNIEYVINNSKLEIDEKQ